LPRTKTIFASSPRKVSPRFTSGLKTTRFDFSNRRELSKNPSTKKATFPDFLTFYAQTIPPKWEKRPRHVVKIAELLHAIRDGECDRAAVHMPPRHAKTETLTVRGAAWLFLQFTSDNVLITAASDRLARRFSRKVRTIVEEWRGIKLEKSAEDEWMLPEGGTFVARGVGSPPVGIGFRFIFVEDPIRSRETANSETFREKSKDWYSDDIYTRLEPGGAMILNGTRWHPEDVFAHAVSLEKDAFRFLIFPALAEENDPLGREVGEALWPARYDVAALERIRTALLRESGEYSWQALFQQNPTPRGGNLFKVGMLKIEKAMPSSLPGVRRWDLAASSGKGDWTAGVRLHGPDEFGLFWIYNVRRGQWEPDERNREIQGAALEDGKGIRIVGPQDPGAAGVEASKAFVRMLSGYSVSTERESGSKEVRADPFAAQVNAGNVRLVEGDWNSAFIEELRTFPGKHDDQVDAAAGAFNALHSVEGWAKDQSALDRLTAALTGKATP
jgi:predicted phage terminase large subunit-like protein